MSGYTLQFQITYVPCSTCTHTNAVATVLWSTIAVYCMKCGTVLPPPVLTAAPVFVTADIKPVKLLAFPIPIEKFRNEFDI